MSDHLLAALTTRRGVATTVLALAGIILLAALTQTAGTLAIGIPIAVIAAYLAVWLWDRRWERGNQPAPAPFARRTASSAVRTTLRQDRNAHFLGDSGGFLWRRRVWFEGTGCPPVEIAAARHRQLTETHTNEPVLITVAGDRQYWWWEEAFYWDNEGYTSRDVMALVTRSRRQKERQLQHAHALLDGEQAHRREPIPEDVRRHVWRRDGGQCQECGRTEMLQYDHLIPWSLGGADTAENLRLLCAECNRLKSDAI